MVKNVKKTHGADDHAGWHWAVDDVVVMTKELVALHSRPMDYGFNKAWAYRKGTSNVPFAPLVLNETPFVIVRIETDKRLKNVTVLCIRSQCKVKDSKGRPCHAHVRVPWLWCQIDVVNNMIRQCDLAKAVRANRGRVKIGGRP